MALYKFTYLLTGVATYEALGNVSLLNSVLQSLYCYLLPAPDPQASGARGDWRRICRCPEIVVS